MSDVTDPGLELWERMDPVEGSSMEYIHGEIIMMATPNTIHNRPVPLPAPLGLTLPTDRFRVYPAE